MVDIHCHIVPEVDDGAWDLETAVDAFVALPSVDNAFVRVIQREENVAHGRASFESEM